MKKFLAVFDGYKLSKSTLVYSIQLTKAQYVIEKGDSREKIVAYLSDHRENELVVLGACQRTELSRLFKASLADVLMRQVDTPLFIAHNK